MKSTQKIALVLTICTCFNVHSQMTNNPFVKSELKFKKFNIQANNVENSTLLILFNKDCFVSGNCSELLQLLENPKVKANLKNFDLRWFDIESTDTVYAFQYRYWNAGNIHTLAKEFSPEHNKGESLNQPTVIMANFKQKKSLYVETITDEILEKSRLQLPTLIDWFSDPDVYLNYTKYDLYNFLKKNNFSFEENPKLEMDISKNAKDSLIAKVNSFKFINDYGFNFQTGRYEFPKTTISANLSELDVVSIKLDHKDDTHLTIKFPLMDLTPDDSHLRSKLKITRGSISWIIWNDSFKLVFPDNENSKKLVRFCSNFIGCGNDFTSDCFYEQLYVDKKFHYFKAGLLPSEIEKLQSLFLDLYLLKSFNEVAEYQNEKIFARN